MAPGTASTVAMALSAASAPRATPLARATAAASAINASSRVLPSAWSRNGPMAVRARQQAALEAERRTNFCQIAASMSSGTAASMPAPRQAARKASARALRPPSSSPKASEAMVPACVITPGSEMAAEMAATPPKTCLPSENGGEHRLGVDPVLERDDRRLGAQQGPAQPACRLGVPQLDAEHDHVDGADLGRIVRRPDRSDGDSVGRAFDGEPALAHGLQVGAAGDEGDFLARRRETRAEVAADAAAPPSPRSSWRASPPAAPPPAPRTSSRCAAPPQAKQDQSSASGLAVPSGPDRDAPGRRRERLTPGHRRGRSLPPTKRRQGAARPFGARGGRGSNGKIL